MVSLVELTSAALRGAWSVVMAAGSDYESVGSRGQSLEPLRAAKWRERARAQIIGRRPWCARSRLAASGAGRRCVLVRLGTAARSPAAPGYRHAKTRERGPQQEQAGRLRNRAETPRAVDLGLSLIHISEPTRLLSIS